MDNTSTPPVAPTPAIEPKPTESVAPVPEVSSAPAPVKPPSSKLPWIIVAVLVILLALLGGYVVLTKGTGTNSGEQASTVPTIIEEEPTEIPTPTIVMTTYTSVQLAGNSLKPYTIMFSDDWTKDVKHDDVSDTLTLAKDGSKIVIYQAAYGGGPCDAQKFVQIDAGIGALRRIETDSSKTMPGVTTFGFCGSSDGTTYGTPTSVGAITYELPTGFTPDVLTEMDTIIKTLTAVK